MTAADIDREAVVAACRRRGLDIERVERDGAVLLLHPDAESPLPGAAQMRTVAEAIDIPDIRYVTLALEAYRADGDDRGGRGDE